MVASRRFRSGTTRAEDGHAPLRPVDFLVLAVLHEEPLHGYGIVQQIEERTNGRVSLRPGDVYRVLYRMNGDGLLEPDERRESADAGGKPRTYYRITELGRRLVAADAAMLRDVAAGILASERGGTEASS